MIGCRLKLGSDAVGLAAGEATAGGVIPLSTKPRSIPRRLPEGLRCPKLPMPANPQLPVHKTLQPAKHWKPRRGPTESDSVHATILYRDILLFSSLFFLLFALGYVGLIWQKISHSTTQSDFSS